MRKAWAVITAATYALLPWCKEGPAAVSTTVLSLLHANALPAGVKKASLVLVVGRIRLILLCVYSMLAPIWVFATRMDLSDDDNRVPSHLQRECDWIQLQSGEILARFFPLCLWDYACLTAAAAVDLAPPSGV